MDLENDMKKTKDLIIILVIYVIAYLSGYYSCLPFNNMVLRVFIFDSAATVVTFIFSTILHNSSVYDAYWSLTPFIIVLYLFTIYNAFAPFQVLFLIAFLIWAIRLTVNWIIVFTDFSYEDWRYRKFRDESSVYLWPIINFFGIHYMPTLIVFLGMLPIFKIVTNPLGMYSLAGIVVIIVGILLEFFADRQMHSFLNAAHHNEVCDEGLWKYSRHPNYLGEILVWLGVYMTALPYFPKEGYLAIGFVSVAVMFNIVSIPLMEKKQRGKRAAYIHYCEQTSRLLLLPPKKNNIDSRYA